MNPKNTLAVLPFINRSSDPENEYFSDGITEEIINVLSKVEGLKVISRTSSFYFKGQQLPVEEIGEKLDVQNILEGSIRLGGDQLRISAQLIDVKDDAQLWSQTWDRDKGNLFAVQDEISLLIADKLREHYGHLDIAEHLVGAPAKSFSAYDHVLKGKHHFYQWNPQGAHLAIEAFEKAVEQDEDLIEAHLGLADSYSFLAVAGFAPREESWLKANEAIDKAKAIDSSNARLNYMLGNQAFFTEASFSKALKYGHQSLHARPNFPEALRFLSFLYSLKGDLKKSEQYIQYAKVIDPLNHETRFFEANYLYRAGEYEACKTIIDGLLQENDKNLPAWIIHCYLLLKKNQYEQALTTLMAIPEGVIPPDEKLGLLCLIDVLKREKQPAHFTELQRKLDDVGAHQAHSYLFLVYANLGMNKEAFEVLDILFEQHSSVLLLGFSDPLGSPIHTDLNYKELHHRIYGMEAKAVAKPKASRQSPLSVQDVEKHAAQLKLYLEDEQAYLNPNLSLRSLAEQIDMHPNTLSWLLNDHFGKNYNEFINRYRIDHFKKLIVNPKNNHISMIGLAYESGFNSKTVFNTTFKKLEGMTPKAYKAKFGSA